MGIKRNWAKTMKRKKAREEFLKVLDRDLDLPTIFNTAFNMGWEKAVKWMKNKNERSK